MICGAEHPLVYFQRLLRSETGDICIWEWRHFRQCRGLPPGGVVVLLEVGSRHIASPPPSTIALHPDPPAPQDARAGLRFNLELSRFL